MNHLTETTTEQVALEKLRIGVNNYVSRHAVLSTYQDPSDLLYDSFRMQLESHVLANRLTTRTLTATKSVKQPASWWQHFKLTFALSWWFAWFVTRRPVRYTTTPVTLTVEAAEYDIYPDARLQLPEKDFGRPFMVTRLREVER